MQVPFHAAVSEQTVPILTYVMLPMPIKAASPGACRCSQCCIPWRGGKGPSSESLVQRTWACRLGNVPFLSSLTRQTVPRGIRSGWVGGRWVRAAMQWGWGGTGGGQPPSDGLGQQAWVVGAAAARSLRTPRRVSRHRTAVLVPLGRSLYCLSASHLQLTSSASFGCQVFLKSYLIS